MRLSGDEVRRLRMASLLLDHHEARTPLEVARWFGAMQAQDLASAQWSLGLRCAGATISEVDAAFQRGEILRTWPMRGTIHVLPAEDARWLLRLCGPRALVGIAARRRQLGLTDEILERSTTLLHDALVGGGRLTRSACVNLLTDAGLATQPGHGYHLLWWAAHQGVICIGPQEGKEQTFVLLDEWAPAPRHLEGDDALAEVARRYVRGHGPTTRQELAGWTSLTQGDARRAIEAAGSDLVAVDVDGAEMLLDVALADRASAVLADHDPDAVHVLPGFDELMLGAKDRRLHLEPEQFDAVVPGGNGVFRATLVRDGRVLGTWTRTLKRRTVDISVAPFDLSDTMLRDGAEAAFARYGEFLGLEPRVAWP